MSGSELATICMSRMAMSMPTLMATKPIQVLAVTVSPKQAAGASPASLSLRPLIGQHRCASRIGPGGGDLMNGDRALHDLSVTRKRAAHQPRVTPATAMDIPPLRM